VLAGVIESFTGTLTANLITLAVIYYFVLPKIRKSLNPLNGMFNNPEEGD